jgi:hypothetical protein
VILEVVTGSSFKSLFQKPRVKEIFVKVGKYWVPPEILGLIVVGDRINHLKNHGVKVSLPPNVFDPPKQKIFPVLTHDFHKVISVLLISILGSRASAYARVAPE